MALRGAPPRLLPAPELASSLGAASPSAARRVALNLAAAAYPRPRARPLLLSTSSALRRCGPASYAELPGLVVSRMGRLKFRAVPAHPHFQLPSLVAPGPDQESHKLYFM